MLMWTTTEETSGSFTAQTLQEESVAYPETLLLIVLSLEYFK